MYFSSQFAFAVQTSLFLPNKSRFLFKYAYSFSLKGLDHAISSDDEDVMSPNGGSDIDNHSKVGMLVFA